MCGGKIGQLVRNPVKAISDSLSRVEDIARPIAKAPVQVATGDFKGVAGSVKEAVGQTADAVGLGSLLGKQKDIPTASAPDVAGQADQAASDAAALSAAYKSRRRRSGAYSLFQAGPVLQQMAGSAPKATLLGG